MAVPKGQKENRKKERKKREEWSGTLESLSHPASRGREFHPRFDERDVDTRQMNDRVDFLLEKEGKSKGK